MIGPAVGRIVWFWKSKKDREPLAAIISAVHSPSFINVMAISRTGNPQGVSHVRLIEPTEEPPDDQYCSWMPYPLTCSGGTREGEAEDLTTPRKVAT